MNKRESWFCWHAMTVSALLLLAGCSDETGPAATASTSVPVQQHLEDFSTHVLPLLERRCVHCHACYDAPCRLQLSSGAGIARGAHAEKTYDGTRLLAAQPTRLFSDASTPQQWQAFGFFPVLPASASPQDVNKSLIVQVLQHKREQPLPVTGDGRLQDVLDLSLDRAWHCASPDNYRAYRDAKPYAGMPFALPALDNAEEAILDAWLEAGAPLPPPEVVKQQYRDPIRQWETFLNQDSPKAQLVARYIYEHLYLANLYFPAVSGSSYFKLRRSYTPPGVPFSAVSTRRPFDDPGVQRVYYRVQLNLDSVVAKTHMPYALGERRMRRFEQLFFEPDYEVSELPGYAPEVASNPFASFSSIPVESRYRFMLDHAEFTIRGFMKGSVCRGQVALNVINDHFWVMFVSPDHQALQPLDRVVTQSAQLLRLPAEAESELEPVVNWLELSKLQQQYLGRKNAIVNTYLASGRRLGLDYIWNGDGVNQNALLTVFRHFDSASVRKGLYGPQPKTAWLIDYPILERIHYLLVAGFDVYGNVGHQLLTRLYMDFLRMESEFNFLMLMPVEARSAMRDFWYRDATAETKDYLQGEYAYVGYPPAIEYRSDQPARELFDTIRSRSTGIVATDHELDSLTLTPDQFAAIDKLARVQGQGASIMPESSLLLINGNNPQLVSILRTSAHSNVSELFDEASRRVPAEDYLVVLAGVVGAYPDALWRVDVERLSDFADAVTGLENEGDYRQLMQRFGVRRSSDQFWAHSDAVHTLYQQTDPGNFGVLDYSRLENR